jgi:hypothetical protein
MQQACQAPEATDTMRRLGGAITNHAERRGRETCAERADQHRSAQSNI